MSPLLDQLTPALADRYRGAKCRPGRADDESDAHDAAASRAMRGWPA
jgi:hypothetical protein